MYGFDYDIIVSHSKRVNPTDVQYKVYSFRVIVIDSKLRKIIGLPDRTQQKMF